MSTRERRRKCDAVDDLVAGLERYLARCLCSESEPGKHATEHGKPTTDIGAVSQWIVRLRCACGDLWGMDGDEQVQKRASELVHQLESELIDGGLELRAGLYDD